MKFPSPVPSVEALAFERKVLEVIQRIARVQSKPFLLENQLGLQADGLAPEGVLSIDEPALVEIKLRLIGMSGVSVIRTLERRLALSGKFSKVKNVILVTDIAVEEKTRNLIEDSIVPAKKIKIHYYTFDDLKLFLTSELNRNKVHSSMKKSESFETDDEEVIESNDDLQTVGINSSVVYIKELKSALENNKLTFYLGAGSSAPHGMPSWKNLIRHLLVEGIKQSQQGLDAESIDKIIEIRLKDAGELLGGRLAKVLLEGKLRENISRVLYSNVVDTQESINVKLAEVLTRTQKTFGVVNFNYDDSLARELMKRDHPFDISYGKKFISKDEKSVIYHVHGYIPASEDEIDKHDIVFSEDDYHASYSDVYSWQNVLHLNLMRSKTILFLGLSLRDPNLRRLLEASRIGSDKPSVHYAIIKDPWIEYNSEINKILKTTEEKQLLELGIKIIWVSKYSEVPKKIAELVD